MNSSILSLFFLFFTHTIAAITFSNPSSGIKILSGGQLILNQPLTNCNGIIARTSGGIISGSSIYFNEGNYQEIGNDVTLTATYNPSGSITLAGNNILRSSPGQFLETISIQGTNNRIEGQPYVFKSITLADSATTVTLDIQSTLNNSITLNSGTINLEDTLRFNGGTFLIGPGTINAANNTIIVEGAPLTISQPLYFKNATTIFKNDVTTLQNILSFGSGTSALQGNGNIIQFSTNGGLNLASGANLYISNLVFKGLGSSINPFIFSDATSKMYLSNVTLEFDNNVTTTSGGITVYGPTTAALRDYTWTLDQATSMTIDSATVLMDPLGGTSGSIAFGTPQANYLSLVNSGTIKNFGSPNNTGSGIDPQILSYITNTVIGTTITNASGSMSLDNEKVNSFTIDPTTPLNLTMSNNSIVYLADAPMTFKSTDTLQVNGPGNIMYVSNIFTINGTITLNSDAELIFEFTDQGDERTVIFANPSNLSNQIVLSPESTLLFRNTGSTILSNGTIITCNGTSNADKPRFIVRDDTALSLGSGITTATFKGIGKLQIKRESTFTIGSQNHFIVGTNNATDNIDIEVEEGSIEVGGNSALLSVNKTTATLLFEQGGQLVIEDGGTVELNSLSGIAAPGAIQLVEFIDDGVLNIQKGGNLLIGENSPASSMSWSTEGGVLSDEGTVTLLSQPAFSGVIIDTPFSMTNASAAQIVSTLVQQQPRLNVSTLFIGKDSNKYIRLKNGLIVPLQKGDVITEDVSSTGFVYGMNGETSFFIDLSGKKRAI